MVIIAIHRQLEFLAVLAVGIVGWLIAIPVLVGLACMAEPAEG